MFTRSKLIKLDTHTKYLYPQHAIFFFILIRKLIVFINKLIQHIVTYTCCTAHTAVHVISRPQNNKHA